MWPVLSSKMAGGPPVPASVMGQKLGKAGDLLPGPGCHRVFLQKKEQQSLLDAPKTGVFDLFVVFLIL